MEGCSQPAKVVAVCRTGKEPWVCPHCDAHVPDPATELAAVEVAILYKNTYRSATQISWQARTGSNDAWDLLERHVNGRWPLEEPSP